MPNILTIDTMMDEPRRIVILREGRKKNLPFFHPKSEIVINIPNPSIRKAQELRQKYWAFAYACAGRNEKALEAISFDIVAGALKSVCPLFTKWWIKHNLNNDQFAQILEFIIQPTREKEEEYLKNVLALQKAAKQE